MNGPLYLTIIVRLHKLQKDLFKMGYNDNDCPGCCGNHNYGHGEERVPMCGACMSYLISDHPKFQYIMKDWVCYSLYEEKRCVRCNIKGWCIFEIPKCDYCADAWITDREEILEEHRQKFCFPQIPDSSESDESDESDESEDFDYPDDA